MQLYAELYTMIPLVYKVDEAIFSDSNAPSVAEVSFTTTSGP